MNQSMLRCGFLALLVFSVDSFTPLLTQRSDGRNGWQSFTAGRREGGQPPASWMRFIGNPSIGSALNARKPSKVTDDFGPTPEMTASSLEEVSVEDIPELREWEYASDMTPGPIPHQPWRRGETAGCEDPITAPWRVEAEELMKKAVSLVGGRIIDITWFLTSVLVTIDDSPKVMENVKDMLKASGPVMDVKTPSMPLYYDPQDPNPEEIWTDEDDYVYIRETPEEAAERQEKKMMMYATQREGEEGDPHIPEGADPDLDPPMFMDKETREDAAASMIKERQDLEEELDRPLEMDNFLVDTAALSTIAGAIMSALEDVDDDLKVLSRHELVLTSTCAVDVLETQKQFNNHRGKDIIVETTDPWDSNRVLKGQLLDRNSMDLLMNKQGRMVTIPHNFIKCVRLPRHCIPDISSLDADQFEELQSLEEMALLDMEELE